jgi:triosephosphate isomerase (TIM)
LLNAALKMPNLAFPKRNQYSLMRKKIVAGNWKMNKDIVSGVELTKDILILAGKLSLAESSARTEMIICPPFILLQECSKQLNAINFVRLGAQNCHYEDKGAYTGEVSASMLKSVGVQYVIIGHSERRQYFGEDHEFLKKKVIATLQQGLTPIFCCGEVLTEREAGRHFEIVKTQIRDSLFSLNVEEFSKVIIAYEPVWAIGTGVTATPAQAQEMHVFIRGLIHEKYGSSVSGNTHILYGGSCNAKNAAELFALPDVDGGLIGGASLKADEFIEIARIASGI